MTVSDTASEASGPADAGNAASDALTDAAPVNDTTEPVPATTATALNDQTSDVSGPAIATTGDVVALNDAPPPPENALYTGTEYTDYGVNLSSDIAVLPQDTGSSADAGSGPDTAPPPPEIVDTNHPTDHPEHAIL